MRNTGIPLIGNVPWGTHFCQFYQDKQDLIDILVPYFKAGLENNEFCMWVTSEPLRAEEARAALCQSFENGAECIRTGQIEILDHSEWYTLGGSFDSDRVLAGWVKKLEAARKRGFEGLRLTGNTFWLEKSDWQSFTEYEATVDSVIGRYPMLALCTYSLLKCGAAEIMDVVSNHAFALIQRAGHWQLIESAERKRIEATLRQSRASLDLALEAANAGAWEWDLRTGRHIWSEQMWALFGIEPHSCEPSYAVWESAVHPDDFPEVERAVQEAARAGNDLNLEFRIEAPGGSRWLLVRGRPSRDERGEVARYIGIALDITTRKRGEEEVRQREAALRQVSEQRRLALEAAELGAWEYRFDTGEVFWDTRCSAFFGATDVHQIGYQDFLRCLHPDDRAAVDTAVTQALSGADGGAYHREFRVIWPDTSVHWVASHGRVYFEGEGAARRARRFIGVCADVTGHKRMEQVLRESEQQLRAAALAAHIGVWSWTPGTNNVTVSVNWRRLFGVAQDAPVTFETWQKAVHPDDRERAVRELNEASDQHRDFSSEYRVVWPDGTVLWLADRGRASYDESGRPVAMAGVNVDITEQKRAEAALREHREWLRVTLTSIGDAVLTIDTGRRVTFLNPVAATLTGWTEKEALGRPVREVFRIIDEQSREEAEDIVARVMQEGKVVLLANHTALLTRDGREVPIEDSAAPIWDSDGNVSGAVVVFHDVTAKRRAEEALRQSEGRVRTKLESILSPEGDIRNLELGDIIDVEAVQSLMDDFYRVARIPMAIIDLKGKILVGVGWQDVCTKFHRAQPEACRHCIESDTELTVGVAPGEFKLYKCKNNLWDMATPLMVGSQRVGNVFTGQFFLKDEPVDYEVFRSQAAKYGFQTDEYLAALETVPRVSRENVNAGMEFLAKLGRLLSMLSYSNVKLARAVAEREALTASLNRAQEIAHVGSWELNIASGRLSWSNEVYRIFGFEPQEFGASYAAFLDAVHPDDRPAVDAAYSGSLRNGESYYEIEHRVVRSATGEVRWVHEKCEHIRDGSGAVVRSVGMVQDITERKRAEEQLRQAQKLESIGLLAGGIAHDFNNLLVGVIGNASLAEDMLPYGSPAAEVLRRIVACGEQAAHLTRQMLAYAGKGQFVAEPVNLSGLVRETSTLLQGSISKRIAIGLNLASDISPVESDPSQMQQIFMNLALNAAEAIGSAAGSIYIATGEMNVDAAYIRNELQGWPIVPGHYVYLDVRDTGCGMDEKISARIFDPFFTTKFQGRGLGLAAVAGIVRAYKGAIHFTTAPDAGTAFRVLLPAMQAKPAAAAPVTRNEDDLAGRGTILVVDDEAVVRDLARRSLERQGYEVVVAESGPAAIDVVRNNRDRIRLVVLDLSMPGMSGEETLPELRRLRPELDVIVSSGHSESEALRPFDGARVSGFLQKPYTTQTLARKVKAALA